MLRQVVYSSFFLSSALPSLWWMAWKRVPLSLFKHLKQPLQLSTKGANKK